MSWILAFLLLVLLAQPSWAFTPSRKNPPSSSLIPQSPTQLHSTASSEIHPAVQGWPEKYATQGGQLASSQGRGPRILHTEFTVQPATEYQKYQLNVDHWPIWTTSDKPKWTVGNQNKDKIMPYGELSFMISGVLEIISYGQNKVILVQAGDFVTFPQGFQASWRVLEEVTWHYYLY